MLTDLQNTFVRVSKEKEELVQKLKEVNAKLESVMVEIGLGNHFQDNEGTVYVIDKPAGTFVSYKTIDYIRTRRNGETKGDLSLKAAKELGYVLNNNGNE